MRKKLKGFTLTEVMVSLVILSILITISSAMIISSLNLLLKNAQIRDAQNNGNEIFNLLENKLRYSQQFIISTDDNEYIINASYTENIDIHDGEMSIDLKPVYSREQLRNADCDISICQLSDNKIKLSVEIKRHDELVYSKSGDIYLENAVDNGNNSMGVRVSNLENEETKTGNMKISIGYYG